MSIYPQALALVKEACEQCRKDLMTEELMQYRLMVAASIIVALQERELRRYLENAESRIEHALFTSPRPVHEQVLRIVSEVECEIAKWDTIEK